jgi:hypothetical protein
MKTVAALHRTIVPVMALVVAACTSGPPPTPPPTREQVQPLALEETGLACLDLAPEVVAAHHERAPMFGASSCDTRALDYAGAFGLIGAIAAIGVASSCRGPEDGLYVDVAATIRDRFASLDRRFSTEVFECDQRSEGAGGGAHRDVRPGRIEPEGQGDHRGASAATGSRPRRLDQRAARRGAGPVRAAPARRGRRYRIVDARYERVREAWVIRSQAVRLAIGRHWDGMGSSSWSPTTMPGSGRRSSRSCD